MGFRRLPKSQKLITKENDVGVGNIFKTKIKGIGETTARLLTTKNTSVKDLSGLLLSKPALGAHKSVSKPNAATFETQCRDHAVTIKGVVNTMAIAIETTGSIAIQGPAEIKREITYNRLQWKIEELLVDGLKRRGPITTVVTGLSAGNNQG